MDPRKVYAPDPQLAKPRPKSKGAPNIAPIHEDTRFAELAAVLRFLEDGMSQIEREADALRIEDYLTLRPKDPRAPYLNDRLKKYHSSAPAKKVAEPANDAMPDTVAVALELLNKGSRPVHRNRKAIIQQLEGDRDLIGKAILDQRAVIDALRDELSSALAIRLVKKHRELVLGQFRAAQALAAATDLQDEFRSLFISAGYTWRDDLLPAPQLRAALVLGSEATFESDISRTRRALEELKIIQ
jgi:hypothetical protein